MSKIIKDPIHGYIPVDEFVVDLIDTKEVQRLRRIRQLGFSYLVYPGANHSRFEHSLGTYHLANLLCENIDVSGADKRAVEAAALLHDIGHGPFSHTSEEIVEKAGGVSHEKFAKKKILESSLRDRLREHKIPIERVNELIDGEGEFGEVVSSELDVDRMDYLLRDAHYTGVAYGVIDYERLINEIKFVDGELIVKSGGLEAAESLLVSRFLMQPTVYFHHASRIAETMASRAIEKAFGRDLFGPNEFREMFDNQVMLKMANSEEEFISEIANRLFNRNLLKKALSENIDSLNKNELLEKIREDKEFREKKEEEIGEKCGCSSMVFIDVPISPEIDEMKTNVEEKGKIKEIGEVSSLARNLKNSERDYLELKVYCPEEKTEKVNKFAKKVLNF